VSDGECINCGETGNWCKCNEESTPTRNNQMIEEKTIDLLECFSCGSKHEKIPLHEYNLPNPPWTHYFTCPTSGDPVSIATAEVAGKPTIIHQDVANFLAVAKRAGHYLVAVFHKPEIGSITEQHPLKLSMRTEEFDLSWGETAWVMLRDELRKMRDQELGIDPVDENDYPRPTPIDPSTLPGLNLFSANDEIQEIADEANVSVPDYVSGKLPIQADERPADVPPTGFNSIEDLYLEESNRRED